MDMEDRVVKLEDRISRIERDLSETVSFQRENTKNLGTLITETKEIVALHRDIQSAVRVGTGLQRFGMWVMKVGVVLSSLHIVIEQLR